jgi:glycosyltransferase involved in cell wall biosynthesis
MRVLLVSGGEYRVDADSGGYLYDLAARFAASGYNVTVLDRKYSPSDTQEEIIDRIEFQRLPAIRFNGRLLQKVARRVRLPLTIALLMNEVCFAFAVALALRRKNTFQVVHVFTVALSFVLLLLLPNLRQRIVYVSITARRLKDSLSLFDRFAISIENQVVRWAGKTVTLNAAAREHMTSTLEFTRGIHVIPHGIDPNTYDPLLADEAIRTQFGLNEDPIVLYVGRITESKGIEYLLRAANRVVNEGNWARVLFVLVGPGEGFGVRALGASPYMSKISKLVRESGLGEHVRWLGAVKFRDLLQLYRSCEVFVLPTLFEQMPYVLIEAMAFAKPVVASRVDGIPLIIEDGVNGLLVEPRDEAGLAGQILRLLQDPKARLQLGTQARKSVVERFAWDPIIRAWRQLHERVAVDGKGEYG